VSNIGKIPALPQQGLAENSRTNSSGVMAFTIILLTITFAYSSILIAKTALLPQEKENNLIAATTGFFDHIDLPAFNSQPSEETAESDTEQKDESLPGFFSFPRNDGSVRWPKLKLTGCGASADGSGGFAIINGRHVMIGETISKVTLVEVLPPQHAVVEYKGEQKKLTVTVP